MPQGQEKDFIKIGKAATGEDFLIDPNLIVTGRTCVIGASGSGKSYAVAVICEELCKKGIGFAILDTEGEYAGIKEKYKAILVSNDDKPDLKLEQLDMHQLAEQAPDIDPIILDLSDSDKPKEVAESFLIHLYTTLSKRRVPYLVIIEEADRFVPQQGDRLKIIAEIARRGRKRGMGLMVCTQRPSLVDKNILSQCGNQLIGRLVIMNDLQSVSQFFSARTVPKQLTSLAPGNFYAMGGFSPQPVLIRIRARETPHLGATPILFKRNVKPFMGSLSTQSERKSGIPAQPQHSALKTLLSEEEALRRVKKNKSFFIFGEEESIQSISLTQREIYQLTVKKRRGILKKEFDVKYMLFDAERYSEVTSLAPIRFDERTKNLWGLSAIEIIVLRKVSPDRYMTALDIAKASNLSRNIVTGSLLRLEKERLISSLRLGRSKSYRRLIELPEAKVFDEPIEVAKEVEEKSILMKFSEVVKALLPGSDVVALHKFSYPLYRIELSLLDKKRIVWIDARNGEEIKLP